MGLLTLDVACPRGKHGGKKHLHIAILITRNLALREREENSKIERDMEQRKKKEESDSHSLQEVPYRLQSATCQKPPQCYSGGSLMHFDPIQIKRVCLL